MIPMIVLYIEPDDPFLVQAFACMADDGDHAEEQCLDAEPDAEVLWVHYGDDALAAMHSYWDTHDQR
jgi:hypothetical protein